MEYAFAELLTRSEMLTILQQRQLAVPNLAALPTQELERIYKSFVLPLARRERRKVDVPEILPVTLRHPQKRQHACANVLATESENLPKWEDAPDIKRLKITPCEDFLTSQPILDFKACASISDDYLSNATKRIKIAW